MFECFAYMYAHMVWVRSACGSRRGCKFPWSWSCEWLWVLGINLQSSERATTALTHRVIFLVLIWLFLSQGFHYVVLAGLELSMWTKIRLALNSHRYTCPSLLPECWLLALAATPRKALWGDNDKGRTVKSFVCLSR